MIKKYCITEFIEVTANSKHVIKRKLVHNIGVNDAPYNVYNNGLACPYYKVWHSMIVRCYKPHKGWEDCTVHKDWYYFMCFRRWMEKQDWKNLYLDKDILVLGNKEYGPDACVFVTPYVNSLFRQTKLRKLPKGIYDGGKKYSVNSCVRAGVKKYIGTYSSLEEANIVYIRAKAKVLANEFKNICNTKVKDGLYRHILNLNETNIDKINEINAY